MVCKTSRQIVGKFDENFESRSKEMGVQLDSEMWISKEESTYNETVLLLRTCQFMIDNTGHDMLENYVKAYGLNEKTIVQVALHEDMGEVAVEIQIILDNDENLINGDINK